MLHTNILMLAIHLLLLPWQADELVTFAVLGYYKASSGNFLNNP